MRVSICTAATIILSSIFISGCTGSNLGAVDGYSHTQNNANNHIQYGAECFMGAQAALTQPVFMSNAPECLKANTYPVVANGLRGSSPSYYNVYDQGTVLRSSAPYGSAVHNNTAYHHTARPEKNSGGYVSIGGVAYDVGDSVYGIQGRAGYNFNPYLGVEAEASFGLIDQNIISASSGSTTLSADVGVNNSFGAFAVARVPVSKGFSLFARGGYHTTNFGLNSTSIENGNTVTEDISQSYDGVAYGVGIEVATGLRNAVRLDYTRYQITTDLGDNASDTVSVSFVQKF